MNDKSHYTIGKNTTWPLTWPCYAALVFLRANDKRINDICRQEINQSPFLTILTCIMEKRIIIS